MGRAVALLGALVLVVAACGDAGEPATSVPPPATTAPAVTSAPTTAAPTTTTAPTTTVAPTTTAETTTTTAAPTTTVAPTAPTRQGEPFDTYVPIPSEGPVIGVVGVRFDDTLNVREGPGVQFGVVTTLAPTATGIQGTGSGWQTPNGAIWWEIDTGDHFGWASSRFLARLGDTTDLTSSVVGSLGGLPSAPTMEALGELVAETFVDPDVGSDVTQVTPATVGDLGEVTFDVIGLGDDSVGGVRLHVFGTPDDGGFALRSVEGTTMCSRGVSDGICV